ncbi:three-helix bundle dimerization domain-containing protein [Rhodococcus sp. NPDC060086]|uniref:three-helix bundle dimerization domain-containing protein n=1 Tax=Rhodococcus sp. NPDC060086 TaxID=3347055 RepID=UPI00365F7FF9
MRGDDDEMLQIEEVIARMIIRYPAIPPADIENTVRTVHKRFVNGKIRDFVPLLVEKAARRYITESVSPMATPPVLPPAG